MHNGIKTKAFTINQLNTSTILILVSKIASEFGGPTPDIDSLSSIELNCICEYIFITSKTTTKIGSRKYLKKVSIIDV